MHVRRLSFLSGTFGRSKTIGLVFRARVGSFVLTVDDRVVLFLLPSVTFLAVHAIRAASILDALNILILLPVRTLDRFIVILFRISSEILNIVGVDTDITVMLGCNGTPYSLISIEMKFQILF